MIGIFGFFYFIGGIIEVFVYFGKEIKVIGVLIGDFFVVFVFFMISVVYLIGFKRVVEGDFRSVFYFYVGVLLSIGFVFIVVFVMGLDVIEVYLFYNEDFVGWSLFDDVIIYFVFGVFLVIVYLFVKDVLKNLIKVRV